MADPTANPLKIVWEARAENLCPRVVKSWSIDTSYLTSTDEWTATVYDTEPARLRGLALEPVTLHVDGHPQLIGWVERISRGQDGSVTISGRDHLAQLVECNVDPQVAIKAEDTLDRALLTILAPCGIRTVLGDGDYAMRQLRTGKAAGGSAGPDLKALKPGELKPEAGMGCYDFANRIVARLGATIQPGPARDAIMLTAPSYDQEALFTLIRSTDPRSILNNIVTATSDEDYSKFPTAALSSGKITKAGEAAQAKSYEYDILAAIEGGGATALANVLRPKVVTKRITPKDAGAGNGTLVYRFLYVKDDEARSLEQITKGVTRAVCERLKDTLVYKATMKGYSDWHTGAVYAVDAKARVEDDVCDVHETLWVASRSFRYSESQGTSTAIECWRPGSFTINAG